MDTAELAAFRTNWMKEIETRKAAAIKARLVRLQEDVKQAATLWMETGSKESGPEHYAYMIAQNALAAAVSGL